MKALLKRGDLNISAPSVELHSKGEARTADFRAGGLSGAKASAVIYSIVETAKENVLNPVAYLCHLSERLSSIDHADSFAIHELLPYSTSLPSNCGIRQ